MSSNAQRPEPDCMEGAPHPRLARNLHGQDRAERQFLKAVRSGRMHHAWIISGPRGTGKATLAWKIARYMLAKPQDRGSSSNLFPPIEVPKAGGAEQACPDAAATGIPAPDPDDPLNRRITALSEPRLHLCRRPWDEKKKRLRQFITVDEIRRLKARFSLKPTVPGWRVAIIDSADEMNANAANALLKILEEPPQLVLFLLVCHQPARLPATILSRCRRLECGCLDSRQLNTVLSEIGFDQENQGGVAELSCGAPGEAVRLIGGGGIDIYADLIALLSDAPGINRRTALSLAEQSGGRGKNDRFALTLHLMSVLLARLAKSGVAGAGSCPEAVPGETDAFRRLAPDSNAGRVWADTAQSLASRAADAARVNLDPAAVILDMLLKTDAAARRAVSRNPP